MRSQAPFFSAPHHSAWFIVTAFMFVLAGFRLIEGETDVSALFLVLHGLILNNALSALRYGRIERTEIYTIDCVWYNLFMVEMHALSLLMFALAKRPVGL